mmetsp:Transcript_90471/g.194053  ORF Transcript_90471/g.194053 Transcript_90471/m.194053 type:complete len:328 (+) Transcript_90471:494-1477(+)
MGRGRVRCIVLEFWRRGWGGCSITCRFLLQQGLMLHVEAGKPGVSLLQSHHCPPVVGNSSPKLEVGMLAVFSRTLQSHLQVRDLLTQGTHLIRQSSTAGCEVTDLRLQALAFRLLASGLDLVLVEFTDAEVALLHLVRLLDLQLRHQIVDRLDHLFDGGNAGGFRQQGQVRSLCREALQDGRGAGPSILAAPARERCLQESEGCLLPVLHEVGRQNADGLRHCLDLFQTELATPLPLVVAPGAPLGKVDQEALIGRHAGPRVLKVALRRRQRLLAVRQRSDLRLQRCLEVGDLRLLRAPQSGEGLLLRHLLLLNLGHIRLKGLLHLA